MQNLPDYIENFLEKFRKNKYQIYVVGGSVRDLLLQKEVKNWDFTTSAKPEEIVKLFPDSFYNNQFGTVGIPTKVGEETFVFEVTTYRKEADYSNLRHPEKIEWTDNVSEDLARRDFTINAMAYDGATLIDPFGGQTDLQNKLIKAVGDPNRRFNEDALRLLRAVRFTSQLGFLIEEKTLEAIQNNAQLIQHISGERIRDEFFKILSSEHPSEGVLFLRTCGLLQYILPEVDEAFSIDQKSPMRHHIYDVGTHLVMALKHCPSTDVITRFATLIHDIGKVKTYKKDEETGLITFYNHEVVGAKQAEKIAERFRLSNKQKEKLIKLVAHHQFTVTEDQTDKALRRFIRDVSLEYLDDMIALRVGDRIGSGATPTSWRFELFKKRLEEVQQIPFLVTDLKINGSDVMKELDIKPGPKVGQILESIFAEVEEGTLKNEKEILLEKLKTFTV